MRRFYFICLAILCVLGPSLGLAAPPKELRPRLQRLLSRIEALPLGVWEEEKDDEFRGQKPGNFKVLRTSGGLDFLDEIPKTDQGVSKLYECRAPLGFQSASVNGQEQWRWVRLYWWPDRRSWHNSDPLLGNLVSVDSMSNDFVRDLTTAYDSLAGHRVYAMLTSLGGKPNSKDMTRIRKELAEYVPRAGDPWGGKDLLEQIVENKIQYERATSPSSRVMLMEERRRLLRECLQRVR